MLRAGRIVTVQTPERKIIALVLRSRRGTTRTRQQAIFARLWRESPLRGSSAALILHEVAAGPVNNVHSGARRGRLGTLREKRNTKEPGTNAKHFLPVPRRRLRLRLRLRLRWLSQV